MARARELFPGGVNSPVRAFRGVGGEPFVVERGEGCAHLGRRRQRVHRLRAVVGAAGARPRAAASCSTRSRRRCGAARASAFRPELEVELAELDRRAHAARRDAALRVERHRGDDERDAPRARRRPGATSSSSSTAAITATPTPFSCAPARASRRSGCRIRPACRDALAALTVVAPFNDLAAVEALLARALASRRSSSSRSSATPASSRPIRRFCPGCARSPTRYGALLDLRRGDDGIPHRVRRRARAIRRHGGSDDARQGDRRRTSRGGVRRPPRSHGADRAVGRRVSGGNALRQSARDGGGNRDAATRSTTDVHESIARAHRAARRRDCAASRLGTAFRSRRTAPARCGDSSSAPSRCARSPTRRRRTSSGSSASFTRRSTRSLSRAVGVRGGIHVVGARRRRRRRHARAPGRRDGVVA